MFQDRLGRLVRPEKQSKKMKLKTSENVSFLLEVCYLLEQEKHYCFLLFRVLNHDVELFSKKS